MLATIISKYLQENRRLVIPQLGAFLVKEPGQSVIFSQLLTKDDGVFQNLLIESGMSDVEASGAISRLLFDIRFVLENGGEYWLTGIGHFSKTENGKLHFEFDPVTTPQATRASKQADSTEQQEAKEQVEATKVEATKVEATAEQAEQVATTQDEAIVTKQETQDELIAEVQTEVVEDTTSSEVIVIAPPAEQPKRPQVAKQPIGKVQKPKSTPTKQSLKPAPEEYRHIHFEPDPDLEGLSYGGNSKRSRRRSSSSSSSSSSSNKKLDWWMIIAVSAAVLAISVILYGFLREGAQHGSPIAARVEQRAEYILHNF